MSASGSQRDRLRAIAVRAMRERGFAAEFPRDVEVQVARLAGPARSTEEPTRDLRDRLWCSIDNDDSRDLDQLSVAEALPNGETRVLIAVADVDAIVSKGSPCDQHAAVNTTSVYTPAAVFPMLPERLSTDLTSLNDHDDRIAVVIELDLTSAGTLRRSDVYGAVVRNRAKLAYTGVAAWLDGHGPLPDAAARVPGLDELLRLQDRAAALLDRVRREAGALEFETAEVRHVFDGDVLAGVHAERPNRAKSLIANFMIAANGVTARFLAANGFPSLRRVVRSPERWDRIRALAADYGAALPDRADAPALSEFLARRRRADPDEFVDLSTTVIRLLGSGEYVVDPPGAEPPGHFGLAVRDYSHSTAPNRRYPDLITQRLVKATLAGHATPYSIVELEAIAAHCTRQEDEANRVERQVRKAATAMLVESRIGERFAAIVTGASAKGTYVRVVSPPMEGRVMKGERGLDVGDRVRVRLDAVDVERGYIDFVRE
jgi:VacB/RNase II family 3'-5' exoribonuclease